jgi:hypothetical protein
MNTFVIAALIATVSAEAGFTCVQPDTAWAEESVAGSPADTAACTTACTTFVDGDGDKDTKDYCCFSKTTADSTGDATDGTDDAAFACTLLSFAHADGATIKSV